VVRGGLVEVIPHLKGLGVKYSFRLALVRRCEVGHSYITPSASARTDGIRDHQAAKQRSFCSPIVVLSVYRALWPTWLAGLDGRQMWMD
jgi:hypothetical protein